MLLHARLPSRQTSHAEASQHQASGHGRSCIIHSGSAEQLIVQLSPCVEQEPQPGSHLTGSRAALTSTVIHRAPTQLLGEQLDHMEQSQSLHLTSSSSAPQAVHTSKQLDSKLYHFRSGQILNLRAGSLALTITLHVSTEAQLYAPH